MGSDRVAELFDHAAPLIATGTNQVEVPTGSGSPRWGMSANLRPDAAGTAHIDALTAEVLDVLGESHWPTGAASSSHFTLRPLEPHRGPVDPTDPTLGRYAAALHRATHHTSPADFDLCRVGLAPNCVFIEARPVDDTCARLQHRYAEELDDDGWFQRGVVRDLWYFSLVHFAQPVARGRDLVAWVRDQADGRATRATCDRVQILSWDLSEGRVVPTVLDEVRFLAG